MAEKAPGFFDTFTGDEAALMETIMAELKSVPWAQPLLKDIADNGGLCGANMARFFELRHGHALHKTGITPGYEVPGEGASTIDFGFTNKGHTFKVEMMRLTETAAARAATTEEIDEHGTRWVKRILSLANADKKQSGEGETLKAVERICQKCEKGGKPYKFLPAAEAINLLLVDFRTFASRGGDLYDYLHIALGGLYVKPPYRMYWGDGKSRKLISGVFSPHTTVKGVVEVRERLHFIGIVNERRFKIGDHAQAINFVANPHLFKTSHEVRATLQNWPLPLAPSQVLNSVI